MIQFGTQEYCKKNFHLHAVRKQGENIHKLHFNKVSIWLIPLNKANAFRGVPPAKRMLVCFDSFWINCIVLQGFG